MEGLGIAAGVLMLAVMGVMMLGGHWMGRKAADHHHKDRIETAVCPVSGNEIKISSGAVSATVGGTVYYFDNEEHQREFVLNPDKFLPLKGPRPSR